MEGKIEVDAIVYMMLVELFKVVADQVDGGEHNVDEIHDVFRDHFTKPEVQAFYGELIDSNPLNALIDL